MSQSVSNRVATCAQVTLQHLSHTNHNTVLGMAHNGTAAGMTVDLSLAPQACEHCDLSKHARSPVPKEQEGALATKRLEKVYVDLLGPHTVMSRSRFKYLTNTS
jgi:hypothetical protein